MLQKQTNAYLLFLYQEILLSRIMSSFMLSFLPVGRIFFPFLVGVLPVLRPQSQPMGSTVELDPEVEGRLVEEPGLVLGEGSSPDKLEVDGPALDGEGSAMLHQLMLACTVCDHVM